MAGLGAAGVVVIVALAAGALLLWVPSVANAPSLVRQALNRHHAPAVATVPPRIAAAVVAIEDQAFHSPPGVDMAYGIVRYGYAHLLGHSSQGGSTIAQQLAKRIYVDGRSGPASELESFGLALKLELTYSQAKIMTLYLNDAYFGDGAYGVEQAARRYFGLAPAHLDWAQASLLAGLLQAPTLYDPFRHPALARRRRDQVIDQLQSTGAISAAEAARAARQPLP